LVEKKKVVVFLPKPHKHDYHHAMPLSVLSTTSLIDRSKFDVQVFSATDRYDFESRLLKHAKDAVCFSVSCLTGYQIQNAIDMIQKVRKANPKLPIIWGGWHASILPQQTLESKYADIVVIGQGERTFAELTERLASGKSLRGLQGIAYKDQNKKIVFNKPRPFEDPNNFPPLPVDLINVEDFIDDRDELRELVYITSQGCPFDCGFCAEPLVFKRMWKGLSAKRVGEDLQKLVKKHDVGFVTFSDDNFFVSEKRVQEICKEIIKRNLNIKWGRVNGRTRQLINMKKETWELMRKSGCADILVGAESGMQEGLDLINKMTSIEDTVKLIELAREYDIEITPSLMVGLPFPSYKQAKSEAERNAITEKELNAILDMLDQAYPTKDYFEVLLFVFTPYPGNPLFQKSIDLGFKPPKKLEEWAFFDIEQQNLPWISDELYGKVQQLMDFIFPYSCNKYLQRHAKGLKPIHWIFHKTALFRWKHRFFAFPIEHKLLMLFRNVRSILRR
tara:strand:- start:6694 stop:8205 length:1512 start_codon:yes stop_codon:yes gene_type:complete